jgi:hypothetical protein
MELSDFVIGETFCTHHGAFLCTDIGTRVVVAVKLGPREIARAESVDGELLITKRIDDDPSWLNGPPYAVTELRESIYRIRIPASPPVKLDRQQGYHLFSPWQYVHDRMPVLLFQY